MSVSQGFKPMKLCVRVHYPGYLTYGLRHSANLDYIGTLIQSVAQTRHPKERPLMATRLLPDSTRGPGTPCKYHSFYKLLYRHPYSRYDNTINQEVAGPPCQAWVMSVYPS
jgi:hypothetical protein